MSRPHYGLGSQPFLFAFFVALVVTSAGCTKDESDSSADNESATVVVAPGQVDQKGMLDVEGNRSGVEAAGIPSGLPRELPRYPGAHNVNLGSLRPQQSDNTHMVVLTTKDDFDTVDDWYAKHVPRSFTARRLSFQGSKISTYDRTQGRYSGTVMIRMGRDPVSNDKTTMITLLTKVK